MGGLGEIVPECGVLELTSRSVRFVGSGDSVGGMSAGEEENRSVPGLLARERVDGGNSYLSGTDPIPNPGGDGCARPWTGTSLLTQTTNVPGSQKQGDAMRAPHVCLPVHQAYHGALPRWTSSRTLDNGGPPSPGPSPCSVACLESRKYIAIRDRSVSNVTMPGRACRRQGPRVVGRYDQASFSLSLPVRDGRSLAQRHQIQMRDPPVPALDVAGCLTGSPRMRRQRHRPDCPTRRCALPAPATHDRPPADK